jgi:hypothetical protein
MDDKPFEDAVALLKIVEAESDPAERARLLGIARKTIRRVCLQNGVPMRDADIQALARIEGGDVVEGVDAALGNANEANRHAAGGHMPDDVTAATGAEYWMEYVTRTLQRLSESVNVAPPSHFCLRHG